MTGPRAWGGTWQRLVRRLYFLAMASVVMTMSIVVLVPRLGVQPPPPPPFINYLLLRLVERLEDPAARSAEARRVLEETQVQVSVYGRDNALLVSNVDPPVPPPAPAEWAQLTAGHEQRREEHGNLLVGVTSPTGSPCAAAVRFPHRPPPEQDLALVVVVVLLGLVALSAWFASMLAAPLKALTAATESFGRGDTSARADLTHAGVFADLASTFNTMADQVETSLRAEKELLANVSHELRTPLSRIRVALDLADEGDAALARESLGEISTDLAELERMVGDVLTATRLDSRLVSGASPLPLRREDVAVGDLINRAAQRCRAAHPEHVLDVQVEEGLPALHVDPALVRRAFDNILDNAGKYSERGSRIALGARREPGGVALVVEDQGMGIAPQDQARLFTPFFRAEKSRTRAGGGVGLGLLLARRILEAHGGTMRLESQVSRGTRVTLHLPAPAPGASAA